LHQEVSQLEVVLAARRQELERVHADSLICQSEVRALSEQVRSEELATVTALSTTAASASAPLRTQEQHQQHPLPLLHWAAGFAANAPASVAADFQRFLAAQEAALVANSTASASDVHLIEDDAGMDEISDACLGEQLAAAADLSRIVAAETPITGAALAAFGKVKPTRQRATPYDGATANDIAAGTALADQAAALLGAETGAIQPAEATPLERRHKEVFGDEAAPVPAALPPLGECKVENPAAAH
jgi:hypothetical protein